MPNFKGYLLFYRRYIDDGIGLWNCSLPDSQEKFNQFFRQLNDWGRLRWTCTGFVTSLVFMDLTISIKNRHLHYKTYQKEHNLYLYIPPLSAHPREMLRGLIFGRLRAYCKHNTDLSDYYEMAYLLSQRLIDRGWSWNYIAPIFMAAHDRITGKSKRRIKPNTKLQPIILHTKYHPRGIQQQQLQKLYNDTLGVAIKNPVIIATSRPRNLKDILTRSKLPPVDKRNPSD